MPCRVQEFEEDGQYLDSRTKSSFDYEESPKEGLWLYDHQGERAVSTSQPIYSDSNFCCAVLVPLWSQGARRYRRPM